jgi:hypothetical protein
MRFAYDSLKMNFDYLIIKLRGVNTPFRISSIQRPFIISDEKKKLQN